MVREMEKSLLHPLPMPTMPNAFVNYPDMTEKNDRTNNHSLGGIKIPLSVPLSPFL